MGFIEFKDSSVVDLMSPERKGSLLGKLADIHKIPFDEPSDESIRRAVESSEFNEGEWEDYQSYLRMAKRNEQNGRANRARQFRKSAAELRESWFEQGVVERGKLESLEVTEAVRVRADWTQRYDPIRLTVQHDAFVNEHIEEALVQHNAVNVMDPDLTLSDVVQDPEKLENYRVVVGSLLSHLGVDKLMLIRGLPICEFSFGYTRVSSSPNIQEGASRKHRRDAGEAQRVLPSTCSRSQASGVRHAAEQ